MKLHTIESSCDRNFLTLQMEDGDDVRPSALLPPVFRHSLIPTLNHPQKTFNHDEVQGVVSESVETVLGTATYSHSKVGTLDRLRLIFVFRVHSHIRPQVGLWQATIVENVCPPWFSFAQCTQIHLQVLKKLAHFNRPFKYIGEPPFTSTSSLAFAPCPDAFVVTCMVAQNTGSSTHTAHTYVSIGASMRDRESLYPHAARCFWDTETDGIAHAASHCAFRHA
jgi:hypothetical protein